MRKTAETQALQILLLILRSATPTNQWKGCAAVEGLQKLRRLWMVIALYSGSVTA